jgi:hypothetical protein
MRDTIIRRIRLPQPKMGGKMFLIQEPGLYVFEEGPATLITLAVTHAGSGTILGYDGVPDENGRFPDEEMQEWMPDGSRNPDYDTRNGRAIYRATPAVMGSWMASGGCFHGLVIHADGGGHSVCPFATVVWNAYKAREKT